MIRSRLFKGTAATGGVALAACCAPLIVAPIVVTCPDSSDRG
jgi:hypothetical protein